MRTLLFPGGWLVEPWCTDVRTLDWCVTVHSWWGEKPTIGHFQVSFLCKWNIHPCLIFVLCNQPKKHSIVCLKNYRVLQECLKIIPIFNSWMQWTSLCGNSVSLAPSDVNVGTQDFLSPKRECGSKCISQRITFQNVQFGLFTSNIERCSVAFSETDDVLTSCGFWWSESCCNRLYFQRGNREFDKTIWLVQLQKKRIWKWLQPLTTAVVRRGWEPLTLPYALSRSRSTVVMSLLFAMELCHDRELNFLTCGLEVLWQPNCLDRMAFRWQKLCVIPRDCEKRLHGSSDLFRSQEAERIFLCKMVFVLTVNSIKTSRTRAKAWLILLGK